LFHPVQALFNKQVDSLWIPDEIGTSLQQESPFKENGNRLPAKRSESYHNANGDIC
jgi:hypothetical protein